MRRIHLFISVESLILIAICLADMLSTLYFVLRGLAVEQNPIMAACIQHSPATFVVVKILSFVPFVLAVELYRRRNPAFAKKTCKFAIALYLLTFSGFTIAANVF